APTTTPTAPRRSSSATRRAPTRCASSRRSSTRRHSAAGLAYKEALMHRIAGFALFAIFAAGCSSDPATPYTGTWSFTSGADNVSCPNGTTSTQLMGNLTIKRATDGGLVVLDPEGCNFTYALEGAQASAKSKSCSFPVPELGQGVTAAVTYDTITLATSDG